MTGAKAVPGFSRSSRSRALSRLKSRTTFGTATSATMTAFSTPVSQSPMRGSIVIPNLFRNRTRSFNTACVSAVDP